MVTITLDADKYSELQILAMENLRYVFDKYKNAVQCQQIIDTATKLGLPNTFIHELQSDFNSQFK